MEIETWLTNKKDGSRKLKRCYNSFFFSRTYPTIPNKPTPPSVSFLPIRVLLLLVRGAGTVFPWKLSGKRLGGGFPTEKRDCCFSLFLLWSRLIWLRFSVRRRHWDGDKGCASLGFNFILILAVPCANCWTNIGNKWSCKLVEDPDFFDCCSVSICRRGMLYRVIHFEWMNLSKLPYAYRTSCK